MQENPTAGKRSWIARRMQSIADWLNYML